MVISGCGYYIIVTNSEETIKHLLHNMFNVEGEEEREGPPDWVIVNGTNVLLTALERRYNYYY